MTARDQVVDAEAAWSTTHARRSRVGGRIDAYAAARAAIARAQAGAPRASESPGQLAGDQGALARWRRYLLDLAEAGVVVPLAAAAWCARPGPGPASRSPRTPRRSGAPWSRRRGVRRRWATWAYLGAPGVAPVEAGIHLGDGLMIGADPASGVLRVEAIPGSGCAASGG